MPEDISSASDDAGAKNEPSGVKRTVNRLRSVSVTATKKVLLDYDFQPGMWAATGLAIAHAPNLTDLRSPATGAENITFDAHGHSARDAPPEVLKQEYVARVKCNNGLVLADIPAADERDDKDKGVIRTSTSYSSLDHAILEEPLHAKASWPATIKHGFAAFWKFFITPTGLLITIYGLNVVAWGAMLFFLLLHASPAMDHPDHGNADSSPRKIWIEIDSQILNALFCLSSWGLAPWRFRDLCWIGLYRWTGSKRYISRLARRNESWFRMRECDYEEGSVEQALYFKRTFSGVIAPPTATWKLDFVIWMMVFNSLFQVGMAYYMWHYNRTERPSWSTGLFIGLGCASSMFAGIMTWWEGRKVKLIEGPKIKPKKAKGEGEDGREEEEEEEEEEEV